MSDTSQWNQVWELGRGRRLSLECARVMAIVNVTPDSFSDGGELATIEDAVEYGLECLDAGADVLDIGGESTRPGAARVGVEEQIARVVPVVRGILEARPEAILSVDTTLPLVAEAALEAGAFIVNDVSAGLEGAGEGGGDGMFELVAKFGAGMVLMHRLRAPRDDVYSDAYGDGDVPDYEREGGVVQVVGDFLQGRADAAICAGVERSRIVIDPGLGFGKTVAQNFELIRGAGGVQAGLGYPILSGASRKSFIGAVTGIAEPRERVAGSVAVSVSQYLAGVRLFRVHDVAAQRQGLAVAMSISAG